MICNGLSAQLREEIVKRLSADKKEISELRSKETAVIDKLATIHKEKLKPLMIYHNLTLTRW